MKIEALIVAVGLIGAYTGTDNEFVAYRNSIVDYHCNHYRQLEEADTGEFNSHEVYAKIYQTCDALKVK